jgi:ankyrin repeat protein
MESVNKLVELIWEMVPTKAIAKCLGIDYEEHIEDTKVEDRENDEKESEESNDEEESDDEESDEVEESEEEDVGEWSALGLAVKNCDEESVEKLIKEGADVDDGGPERVSPLQLAILKKDLGLVKLILDNGANVNHPVRYDLIGLDESPLFTAVRTEQLDIVKLLLERGANKDVKDRDGWTALDLAKFNKVQDPKTFKLNNEIYRSLLDKEELDNYDREGRFSKALEEDNESLFKIIDEGKPTGGMVIMAAGSRDTEIFDYILKKGGDPNFSSKDYDESVLEVVLNYIYEHNVSRMLKIFVKYGGDIDCPDAHGDTTLLSNVMELRNNGEDYCIKNIRTLLQWGADVHKKNKKGVSPMSFAKKNKVKKALCWLEDYA